MNRAVCEPCNIVFRGFGAESRYAEHLTLEHAEVSEAGSRPETQPQGREAPGIDHWHDFEEWFESYLATFSYQHQAMIFEARGLTRTAWMAAAIKYEERWRVENQGLREVLQKLVWACTPANLPHESQKHVYGVRMPETEAVEAARTALLPERERDGLNV